MPVVEGKTRVIIEGVQPEIDGGHFPIKRVIGEKVMVEADIFADGHESLSACLLHRSEDEPNWTETPMEFLVNDRCRGSFVVEKIGCYRYTIIAWVDKFKSWRQDLVKRVDARQKDIEVNLQVGANIIADAQPRVSKRDSKLMEEWVGTLQSKQVTQKEKVKLALSDAVGRIMERYADRRFAVTYPKELVETVDSIEFEYAAEGKLSPRQLLGEEKGMRGSGQTSPDVAINFTCENGKCGIYLVENKYTEHHFYGCSAASKTLSKGHAQRGLPPNPNSARCTDIATLLSDVDTNCHQITWGRQYWRILKDCRSEAMIKLACCPAMTDGYQLLRQQALAQGILNAGLFDYVISGVAYDERNIELLGCLKRTGIDDFRVEWSKLFTSGVSFHSFSHQALVTWVTRSRVDYVKRWGEYVSDRYGY